jgi:hypothetical protein
MVAGPASPSGLANRYGVILFKFAASVEVTGLGAISDTLVRRTRWDSPLVERDRNTLLRTDRNAASRYVQNWRGRASSTAVDLFQIVLQREKSAFGERSYFYHLERQVLHGIAIPGLSDDECCYHCILFCDYHNEHCEHGGCNRMRSNKLRAISLPTNSPNTIDIKKKFLRHRPLWQASRSLRVAL